jgi:multiple sugar transport system permease protein
MVKIDRIESKKWFTNNIGMTLVYLLLIFSVLICVIPFYIMIINATHSNADLSSGFSLTPGSNVLSNYVSLVRRTHIWQGFWNSLIITLPSVVVTAYICSLTGYAFSKYNFPFKNLLFWIVMGMQMVPNQASLVGLFQFARILKLINTYWIIILPAIANPISVFWMRTYCDTSINKSIMESARIEGCSEIGIFHRIILPLLKPGIATISIFNFVEVWNNYINPLILINSKSKYPIPLLIAQLSDQSETDLGAQYMGIALSIIPIIIVYGFIAKRIVGGLSSGAVKG